MNKPLPIDNHIDQIRSVLLKEKIAVIQAPPGAGKTTRVPLALMDQPWLKDKKILLLEPRRLAAISCAGHMAKGLNEKVGDTIGYQIRMDKKAGSKTKILVVTEGIFTRMIQGDPVLEDVGLVIFDEFHERNIHSDLGLALVMETLEAFRSDLRVLVMSATMDTQRISHLLGNAPVIESKGKSYPVTTHYLPTAGTAHKKISIEASCVAAVKKALSQTHGDILVFLPGVGEIMRLKSILDNWDSNKIQVIPLYGNLPVKEQRIVFAKAREGKRKVILATAIAETSITIDGITTVVDAGLMRTLVFSPQTGMARLVTVPVAKASADQRRGRAGRTAAGTCYRLWSEYDHSLLKPYAVPEILSSDLAPLVLELAAWGVKTPTDLKWMDEPLPGPVAQAKELLRDLGALDENQRLTGHGKKMVNTGLHPRFSHMVLMARKKGKGPLGCRLAALLMEKDLVRFNKGYDDPDIRLRLEIIEKANTGARGWHQSGVNQKAVKRLLESQKKIARDFQIKMGKMDLHDAGELLAHAYPDWIAKKRGSNALTYLTASGRGIAFFGPNSVSTSDYIVALHLDGNPKNAKIRLAAPYDGDLLENDFNHELEENTTMIWDEKSCEVKQVTQTRFHRIVLDENTLPVSDHDKAGALLIQKIETRGLDILPWTKNQQALRYRVCFLKETGFYPDLPDLSDEALTQTMATWLAPFLNGSCSFSGLKKLDLGSVVSALLPWNLKEVVERQAPTHMKVPSGSKKRLEYHDQNGLLASPVLQVRLQEMFGLTQTPTVAGQRIPVTIHLLSPAGRAVQITQDLKSFWDNTYQEVKKDLMGRYPKHYWPDDPYTATPTHRVKPRS